MTAESTHLEPHDAGFGARLNWLRAGVLGANDGIVSTAAIVLGTAGATTNDSTVLLAGAVGMLAGAMSMAAGEYVSVSAQRDSERALLEKERFELRTMPAAELTELTEIYQEKGLSPELAREVAEQLTAKDPLRAHAEAELGLDPDALTNPFQAAFASFVSFLVGASVPLASVIFGGRWQVGLCVALVVVALSITGGLSARLGRSPVGRAVARNIAGGLIAMAITFGLGHLVGGVIG
ncbi:VIT family protein [Nakamurella silvestris]|nr:VIT family protein [Nakamurella silvestris]